MKQKLLIVLVFCLYLLSNFTKVKASALNSMDQKEKIDALYKKQSELYLDFNKNKDEIARIDYMLKKLGVKEVSFSEVKKLFDRNSESTLKAQPYAHIPNEKGVKWTSARYVHSYNGKLYEIQEIRARQSGSNSPLYKGSLRFERSVTNVNSAEKVIGILAKNLAGYIPEIGGALGVGITVNDIIQGLFGEKPSGKIDNISADCLIGIKSSYVYDFVKPYGVPDSGRQVLGYSGNEYYLEAGLQVLKLKVAGEELKPVIEQRRYNGFGYSPFYTSKEGSRWNIACKNYRAYKDNKINFNPYIYQLSVCELKVLGSVYKITIPRGYNFHG